MISLLTFLLLASLTLAADDNWTLTLHATRNGSITVITTIIDGTLSNSSILVPLVVNSESLGGKTNLLNNGSYHLNPLGGSFDGLEVYPRCALIRDASGKLHSVCASDATSMCTRKANLDDLRVNSISVIDSNDSLDLSWNCPSGETCCDYGCCQSDGFTWELLAICTVIFVILLILTISIYCCCCINKKEEKTHRHPAPTVSTRVRSMRITVVTDPYRTLSNPSSTYPARPPSAPPVSLPSPSSSLPRYSTLPSAPPMTSSQRSLPGWEYH